MTAENLATKNKLKKEFVELFGPAVGAGFFHSRDLGLFLLLHQWGYIYLNSNLFKWLKITVLALHSYTNWLQKIQRSIKTNMENFDKSNFWEIYRLSLISVLFLFLILSFSSEWEYIKAV